jgi:hypothetical protein
VDFRAERQKDRNGRRVVVALSGGDEVYKDCINTDSGWERRKFIDAASERNGRALTVEELANWNPIDGGLPDYERLIIDRAREADERRGDDDEPSITYQRITCAELDGGEFEEEFLIKDVLVARQPTVGSGPRKALKTSIYCDMALSLATVTPFLGQFETTRHVRTALMSGESGLSTLQKTLRAIADQKGYNLADIDGLIVSPDLPRIGHLDHMDALAKFLRDDEIEVAIFDPCYLMMPATDSGNLFAQGELLRSMVDVCGSVGCQMILLHHNTKLSAQSFDEPSLDWISWSGFAEFARQWLLLGRRTKGLDVG